MRHRSATPLALTAMVPLLAPVTGLAGGLVMGAVFFVLLWLSVASSSLVRGIVPRRFQVLYVLIISATWVSVAEMLAGAWLFELRGSFGIYLSVIAVNGLLLMQMEENALASGPAAALKATAGPGVLVFAMIGAVSAVRELAGSGALFSDLGLITGAGAGVMLWGWGSPLVQSPAGVFLALGLCLAACNRFVPAETPAKD